MSYHGLSTTAAVEVLNVAILIALSSNPLAPDSRHSVGLRVPPRPAPNNGNEHDRARGGPSAPASYGYRREAAGYPDAHPQRGARWGHPQPTQSTPHAVHMRRAGGRASGGDDDDGRVNNAGSGLGGGHANRNTSMASEPSTDEVFGSMAPCWRLLERAKAYMDQVRIAAVFEQ